LPAARARCRPTAPSPRNRYGADPEEDPKKRPGRNESGLIPSANAKIIGSVTATAWSATEQLALDGQSLTIEDVVGFARRGGTATLSSPAAERVDAARELRRELVDREI